MNNQSIAHYAGFASIDEYNYRDSMQNWTPEDSAIFQAHQHGFTMSSFDEFMREVRDGTSGDSLNSMQTVAQNQSDFDTFRRDLVYAGYLGTGFSYERDGNNLEHGIWQFQGHVSDRSLEQVNQLSYLRHELDPESLNRMLDENRGPNVRNFIQQTYHDAQTHTGIFGASKRPAQNSTEEN